MKKEENFLCWQKCKKEKHMAIVVGADAAGSRLKEVVKEYLEVEGFQVLFDYFF